MDEHLDRLLQVKESAKLVGGSSISIRDQYMYQLNEAREKVKSLEKLIILLDANPAIEEFMNLTGRILR